MAAPSPENKPSTPHSPTLDIPDDLFWGLAALCLFVCVGVLLYLLFPDEFGDLPQWSRQVFGNWLAIMTGGASLAFGLFERIRGKISAPFWFIIAAICILLASFWAWHDQRTGTIAEAARAVTEAAQFSSKLGAADRTIRELRASQDSLASYETPHFKVSVLNTIRYKPDENQKSEILIFVVRVENSGAPSSATLAWISVTTDTQTPLPLLVDKLADGTQIFSSNHPLYIFFHTDFLLDKLARPLDRNGQTIGYLSYFLADGRSIQKARSLSLGLKDITGNKYMSGLLNFWSTAAPKGVTYYYEGTRLNDIHIP